MRKVKPLTSALTAATIALMLAAGGCEKPQNSADKRIRENLDQAAVLLSTGTRQEIELNKSKALSSIAAATREQGTPAGTALARAFQGEADFSDAVALIRQLDRVEDEAAALIAEMQSIGAAVAHQNAAAKAHAGTNPEGKSPNEPLKAFQTEVQFCMAKLGDTEKQIGTTTEAIKAKETQIKDLDGKRQTAAAKAATLIEQSEKVAGRESVDMYSQGLVARKQAADLARDLEVAQGQLAELKRSLAELQRLKAVYEEGAQFAQSQVEKLNAAWDEARKAIADRQASAKALLNEGGDSIKAKAEQLDKIVQKAEAIRQPALQKLDQAISNYAQADSSGLAWHTEMRKEVADVQARNAETSSLDALKKLQNMPSYEFYKLARARALHARGSVYARSFALLQAQQALANALGAAAQQAGQSLPSTLAGGGLAQKLKDAKTSATTDLTAAEGFFGDAAGSAETAERAQNARDEAGRHLASMFAACRMEASIGQISCRYALYCLSNSKADLDSARNLLGKLANATPDERMNLPLFPEDLEAGVITRTGGVAIPTGVVRRPGPGPSTQPITPGPDGQPPVERPSGGTPWTDLLKKFIPRPGNP